jgi:hypothetical protein
MAPNLAWEQTVVPAVVVIISAGQSMDGPPTYVAIVLPKLSCFGSRSMLEEHVCSTNTPSLETINSSKLLTVITPALH